MLSQMIGFLSFLWLNNIPVCTYTIFSYLFVNRHLGCRLFQIVAIVNDVKMNTCFILNHNFVWIYAQDWDCWIIWKLFFSENTNILNLINSYFSIFYGLCFSLHIFCFFPNPRSRWFSPRFSYRSYIVVVLIFRSIFHFELIFK